MKIKYLILMIFLTFILISISTYAQEITREDAVAAIQQAEQDMAEMMAAGFSINFINDTLVEAKLALERADFAEVIRQGATGELAATAKTTLEGLNYEGFAYDNVLEYTQLIAERKQQTYGLSDSLGAFELNIEVQEEKIKIQKNKTRNTITGFFIAVGSKEEFVDISEAEVFLKKSREAFEEERYAQANELLLQAQKNLEEKKAEATTLNLLTQSGKTFMAKNWPTLLIFVLVLIFFGHFSWKKIKIKRTKNKLEKLKIEKKSVFYLMKKAQTDRFEKATLSHSIYNIRMEKYNQRLNEIKQTIPVLKNMLKK